MSLKSIPPLVFCGCSGLQRFLIPNKNNVFSTSADGSILIKDRCIAYRGTCLRSTVRIPDSATSIAKCFYNGMQSAVTGVDFGTSGNLCVINEEAFRQTSIISIEFPEGLKYIYGNPFHGVATIQSMYFPSTLIEYGDVFSTVPNKVEIAPGCKVLKKDEFGVLY